MTQITQTDVVRGSLTTCSLNHPLHENWWFHGSMNMHWSWCNWALWLPACHSWWIPMKKLRLKTLGVVGVSWHLVFNFKFSRSANTYWKNSFLTLEYVSDLSRIANTQVDVCASNSRNELVKLSDLPTLYIESLPGIQIELNWLDC